MGKDVNKAFFTGTLGRDSEIKFLENGTAILSFSIANSKPGKKGANGEWVEQKPNWLNCVAFGELGERWADKLLKGAKIHIECRLNMEEYTDKQGNDRVTPKWIVSDITMLAPPKTRQHDDLDEWEPTPQRASSSSKAKSTRPHYDEDEMGPEEIPF